MSDIYHNLSVYHRLIRHVETMLDTPWYARRLAKLYFWYLTASHISWGDGIVLFRSQRSRFGNSFDSRFCQLLISLWALETTYSMDLHGAWSLIHFIFIISLIFATVPHKDISLGSASRGLWHLPERRNMVDDDVLYEDFTFQAPCPLWLMGHGVFFFC